MSSHKMVNGKSIERFLFNGRGYVYWEFFSEIEDNTHPMTPSHRMSAFTAKNGESYVGLPALREAVGRLCFARNDKGLH